ncbi:nuclear pore complex protein Nup133 [Cryptococcus deuterogattii LA55]|nr:nuclear pore complex protein Nup133 [Cryptococcus deuterogattii LA55]KIR90033.1 nuclear pore complex protein Nup133 [Cryptococcus deuterogattii CBS 10090]
MVKSSDSLAVLITYSDATSPSSHALVLLSVHRSNPPIIDRTIPISFTSGQDQRMLDIPKLLIPTGSTMAFVRFGSAVVMLSLDFDTPYEETLTLKDPNNAYIGAGPVTNNSNMPCVVLIPAEGGLMNVEALEPRASPDSLNRLSTATARLKSKMEQAIFFGQRSDNPLSFELEEDLRGQGDVAEAAELVSGEVVAARSPYTPTIYELRPHLLDRLELLKALVKYIRANGLINQLPQATRRRLSGDGEKVRGALELWDYQNRLMDQSSGQIPSQAKSLLSTSIQVYFSSRHRSLAPSSSPSDELEQDLVRLFFRTEVSNLDKLLAVVFEEFREKQGEGVEVGGRAGWVGEVNQIFIAVERAAAQYREEESDLYAIDREKPAIEMWTASDNLIDSLDHLYTLTEALIKERTRELGSVIDEAPVIGGPTGRIEAGKEELRKEQVVQAMLKRQMGWLAAALCTNMEDKCRVVVRRQIDDGADEQEGIMLKAKWDAMKPRVIRPLGRGKGDSRIQVYIEKFGEDFAFELYRWYIDQGQPHALLTQDEVYGSLITRFFDTHHYPELGWIHNIACKQYGEAAEALAQVLDEGEGKEESGELDFRKVVGSIAKLASMTDISLRGPSEARDQTFQKRVIGGEAVDLESMLDLLTLKDNVGREDDGVDALRVLVLDRSLPKARSEVALLAVWRRIYIRDHWAEVSNTAGRSEQAQRTKLKETMIYRVLKALRSVPEFPQAAIISPYDTSIPPTATELSARFPTLSSEDIAALKADYDDEVAMLMEYVEKNGLEERVKEIRRMIEREWEEEQGREIDEAKGAPPESEVVVVEAEDVETDEDVEM